MPARVPCGQLLSPAQAALAARWAPVAQFVADIDILHNPPRKPESKSITSFERARQFKDADRTQPGKQPRSQRVPDAREFDYILEQMNNAPELRVPEWMLRKAGEEEEEAERRAAAHARAVASRLQTQHKQAGPKPRPWPDGREQHSRSGGESSSHREVYLCPVCFSALMDASPDSLRSSCKYTKDRYRKNCSRECYDSNPGAHKCYFAGGTTVYYHYVNTEPSPSALHDIVVGALKSAGVYHFDSLTDDACVHASCRMTDADRAEYNRATYDPLCVLAAHGLHRAGELVFPGAHEWGAHMATWHPRDRVYKAAECTVKKAIEAHCQRAHVVGDTSLNYYYWRDNDGVNRHKYARLVEAVGAADGSACFAGGVSDEDDSSLQDSYDGINDDPESSYDGDDIDAARAREAAEAEEDERVAHELDARYGTHEARDSDLSDDGMHELVRSSGDGVQKTSARRRREQRLRTLAAERELHGLVHASDGDEY